MIHSYFSLLGTKVLRLINQVGFSGSFEESKSDDSYRNDPMKYVDNYLRINQKRFNITRNNNFSSCFAGPSPFIRFLAGNFSSFERQKTVIKRNACRVTKEY